jgi:hypothetical protein
MRLKTEVPPVAHANDEVTLTDTRNRTRIVGGSGALSRFSIGFLRGVNKARWRAVPTSRSPVVDHDVNAGLQRWAL